MKVTERLSELEEVAERLGVKVSYEPMVGSASGTGGLCRLRGEYRVIIDRRLKPGDRAALLADALCRFDTSALELSESVRLLLHGAGEATA